MTSNDLNLSNEEQHALKDVIIRELAQQASRTSASFEFEIDVLRKALRDLLEVCNTSPLRGSYEDREDYALRVAAVRKACAAADRRDWGTS